MISVSYLKSKYEKEETIKKIDNSIADYIHVDLMDGIYVLNKNFTIFEVINDLKDTSKPLDIHLMVDDPIQYIDDLAKFPNTKIITFHLDSTNNPYEVIDKIKDYNLLVGIALNPEDNISILDNYLDIIDYVLIMSVKPGMGGQKFIPEVLTKVKELENKDLLIGIDGGINEESINYLKELKIDNIISGSYVCMSDDFNTQISILSSQVK